MNNYNQYGVGDDSDAFLSDLDDFESDGNFEAWDGYDRLFDGTLTQEQMNGMDPGIQQAIADQQANANQQAIPNQPTVPNQQTIATQILGQGSASNENIFPSTTRATGAFGNNTGFVNNGQMNMNNAHHGNPNQSFGLWNTGYDSDASSAYSQQPPQTGQYMGQYYPANAQANMSNHYVHQEEEDEEYDGVVSDADSALPPLPQLPAPRWTLRYPETGGTELVTEDICLLSRTDHVGWYLPTDHFGYLGALIRVNYENAPLRNTAHARPPPPQSGTSRPFANAGDIPDDDEDDDPVGYVNRGSVTVKCTCFREMKIKRPKNAFMTFLSANHARAAEAGKKGEKGVNGKSDAASVGSKWYHALGEEERAIWFRLAEDEAARHKERYPEYQYNPNYERQRQFGRKDCTCGAYEINMAAREERRKERQRKRDAGELEEGEDDAGAQNKRQKKGPTRRKAAPKRKTQKSTPSASNATSSIPNQSFGAMNINGTAVPQGAQFRPTLNTRNQQTSYYEYDTIENRLARAAAAEQQQQQQQQQDVNMTNTQVQNEDYGLGQVADFNSGNNGGRRSNRTSRDGQNTVTSVRQGKRRRE